MEENRDQPVHPSMPPYMDILPDRMHIWRSLPEGAAFPPLIGPKLYGSMIESERASFIQEIQEQIGEDAWLLKKELLKKKLGNILDTHEELYKKIYKHEYYNDIKRREHYLEKWSYVKRIEDLQQNLNETNLAYDSMKNQLREYREKYNTLKQEIVYPVTESEDPVYSNKLKKEAQMLSISAARNKVVELQKHVQYLQTKLYARE